jgi:hypothetical protein
MNLRVTSNFSSFGGSCERILGLPQIFSHPVPPSIGLRVAPIARSSGCAESWFPGCPESRSFGCGVESISGFPRLRTLRRSRRSASRLPRLLDPSALLAIKFRVSPALFPRLRLRWIFGFPRFSHLPVKPFPRLRVSPNPASTAESMMTPQLNSNFASSDKPRMNLRVQPGLAHSCRTLDAFSISFWPPNAVASFGMPKFLCFPHRPVWLELRFQFPARSPVG